MFDLMPATPAKLPVLMEVVEAPGLFADALLTDERGSLLFISLWGRDTAVQELLARMSLPIEQGGIRTLHADAPEGPRDIHLDRMPCMEKHSGRMPPKNLFGDLVQVWIYDRLAVEPDRANRRALLLYRPEVDSDQVLQDRLWTLVREVCHLPLLSGWRECVLSVLELHGWMQPLAGHAISAWRLDLGDPKFEQEISLRVRRRELQLDGLDLQTTVKHRRRKAA
ncbi:MAG: hypothetical protein OSA97_05855 [Nevskia sp.]|nr:hypothetical protein [Nevskia sp.]